MTAEGYRTIQLDAQTVAGSTRFAAIFQQDATRWAARVELTAAQLDSESDRWTERGYRMRDISGYGTGGGVRYAAVWEQRAGGAQRTVRGLDAMQYESTLDSLAATGYGPIDVSAFRIGSETRYAAIFEAGGGEPWVERHDLDADADRQTSADLRLQGYRPAVINVHASASGPRFALVSRNSLHSASELRRIDAVVEAMGRTSTVGLSLALTHRGRLVFAKAYGSMSSSSSASLHTSSRFRIGSVSKSMTAIEIMRLVEQGRLELGQRPFSAPTSDTPCSVGSSRASRPGRTRR
jgi:hypothetical protein